MDIPNDNRAYTALGERFGTVGRLGAARATLFWDSQTHMPPGGAWSRGEQLAAIDRACADLIVSPETEDLLETAAAAVDALEPVERTNLGEMRRIWRHSTAVPKELMLEKSRRVSAIQPIWLAAKQANDFAPFGAAFAELMPLYREVAQAKGEALGLNPFDALMDEFDPGLSTQIVDPIFAELEHFLPTLLANVIERQKSWPEPIPFEGDFSADRQRELSYKLLQAVGHDLAHVRIDAAPHPFALAGSPGDNRITTRFDANNVRYAILATLHEAGHALYEAGLPREHAFTPVGQARGATAHESQSTMVEMQAGRSREFLSWLAPQCQAAFGGNPDCWTASNLLNTYRRVGSGFIRVEADEISYPLHIILRYRIEQALLRDDLKVADLPTAWSEMSQAMFGRRPPDHATGCLQDMHWAVGLFGYFPNYALGVSLAAQLFEQAVKDDPAVLANLAEGDFAPYRAWVVPRIHAKASQMPFNELVTEATGAPLSASALERHLRRRYIDEDSP
jgi:carboxypeptidase Taq